MHGGKIDAYINMHKYTHQSKCYFKYKFYKIIDY